MKRDIHPLADLMPPMPDAEFAELRASIRADGLRMPITLHSDGRILDGRHRDRACRELGIVVRTETFVGNDRECLAYVLDLNLKRRHLDESQRAMVAAKLANMKQGSRTDLSPIGEMSQAHAANLLNVGKRSVERAVEVRRNAISPSSGRSASLRGSGGLSAQPGARSKRRQPTRSHCRRHRHFFPEIITAVELGTVPVSKAVRVARLPQEHQHAVATQLGNGKSVSTIVLGATRMERAAVIELAASNCPLSALGRTYPVIYAPRQMQTSASTWCSGATIRGAGLRHQPGQTQQG